MSLSSSFARSSRTGGTPTPSSRSAVSCDRSSVASPASKTPVSWPASTDPLAATCSGSEALVGSREPVMQKYRVFIAPPPTARESIPAGAASSRAQERPRETSRPAVALARDLLAAVDAHVDSRGLHPPPRLGIAAERERDARTEGEDVWPHRLELVVRNLDELDASLRQQLDEPHRHERGVGHGDVDVEERKKRHEVEHLTRTAEMWKIEHDDVDVRKSVGECAHALVVRAVAAPHEQRPLVEPQHVPALGHSRRFEPGCQRQAGLDHVNGHRVDLYPPPFLPGPEENCTEISDERGVVDVDLVRAKADRRLAQHHLSARVREQVAEGLVLVRHPPRIRLGTPAVRAPGGA